MFFFFGQVMTDLITRTDNEMFAHYIFMDNKFIMSTASGLPLTFALSGTFAPGAKGGLSLSRNMVNGLQPILNAFKKLHFAAFFMGSVLIHRRNWCSCPLQELSL